MSVCTTRLLKVEQFFFSEKKIHAYKHIMHTNEVTFTQRMTNGLVEHDTVVSESG